MYERFTDRARKVMQLANQEAQRFNHEYIGTEHILLGLTMVGSGVAALALKSLGADLPEIRREVEKLVQPGPDTVVAAGKLPLTPRGKKAIEAAMEEAHNLKHEHVGTEHILLGLLRDEEFVSTQVFLNRGLRLETVRAAVLAVLSLPDFKPDKTADEVPEPPAVCPKCGQPRVVRVLWNWVHLWGQKEEDVRSGKAILAARDNAGGPPWVCLQCAPGWAEVHRLAMQEWEWQLAKETAVAAAEFEKAAWYRDCQDELWQRMMAVVEELGGEWGQA
jgi:hypothetical protein